MSTHMTTHFNTTTFYTFLNAFMVASETNAHIVEACATWDEILSKEALLSAQGLTSDFYVSEDHRSGFIVRHDGELCAVFSSVRGRGGDLVRNAIYRGASKLDCFDVPALTSLYSSHGFIEIGSVPNYQEGAPRVVFFALAG